MIPSSPIIPTKAKASNIPNFPTRFAPFTSFHKTNVKSTSAINLSSKALIPSIQENITKYCECPHILVADDDPFQEHYYNTLFARSIETISADKRGLSYRIFRSGEALLDRFSSLKTCDCGSQMVIITDYEMGRKNLNGVETALNLRKEGHKGPIVLRTSENKEDLCKRHPSLENLLESKVIDCMLDKSYHLKTSKTIQNLLRLTSETQL